MAVHSLSALNIGIYCDEYHELRCLLMALGVHAEAYDCELTNANWHTVITDLKFLPDIPGEIIRIVISDQLPESISGHIIRIPELNLTNLHLALVDVAECVGLEEMPYY